MFPNPEEPYHLSCDASDVAVGDVLEQYDEKGEKHPVAYASRSLTKTERNYSISEREMLAVVWSVNHFRSYLIDATFIAYTDHSALTYYLSLKGPTSARLARWICLLQPYQMVLKYRPGKERVVANAFSRYPLPEKATEAADDLQRRQEAAVQVAERTAGLLTDEKFWKDKFQIDDPADVGFIPFKQHRVLPLTRLQADEEKRRVYINVPRTVPILDDIDDDVILPDAISSPAKRHAKIGEFNTLNALKQSEKVDWAAETLADPYYGRIVRYIQEGQQYVDTLSSEEKLEVVQLTPHFQLNDGILFHFHQRKEYLRLLKSVCVPETLRIHVYHQFHDSPIEGGHAHGRAA